VTGESPPPIDDDVEAYVLGTLDQDQRRAFEARLAASAGLRERVQAAWSVVWLLAESPNQMEPSARVRTQLLTAVTAERDGATRSAPPLLVPRPLAAPPPRPRRSLARSWATWVAAAAIVCAVGLGGWNALLQQQVQQLQAQRERDEAALQTLIAADRFWTMRGLPERAPDAYSTLALNVRHRQTVLAVTGFPVLPPSQAYQVWVVQGGQQVPVGTFQPRSPSEEQTLVIPSDLQGVTHAMITIEPASGSQQPSGLVVMDGDL
jgi:anti-sigma-K factor RskA